MRRYLALIVSLAVVAILIPTPSLAHKSIRTGRYECWLTAITQYSNYDIKVMSGSRYAFMLGDERVGKPGSFVHDGKKVRFTSGYLKKKGFRGRHAAFVDSFNINTHAIYLYKDGELVYDCNNN